MAKIKSRKRSRNFGEFDEGNLIIPSGLLSRSAIAPMTILKIIGDMERMKFPKKKLTDTQQRRINRK